MISKKEQFRISAKKLLLTYSQIDSKFTNQDILEALENIPVISGFEYIIAKELHADAGTHFHVILKRDKKFEIKNSDILDIKVEHFSWNNL